MAEKDIVMDGAEKNLVAKVNALSGIPNHLISEVLFYALRVIPFMEIERAPEGLNSICIPFIGSAGFRFRDEEMDSTSGKLRTNLDAFLAPSEGFAELYGDAVDRAPSSVAKFIESRLISKTVNNIQNQ